MSADSNPPTSDPSDSPSTNVGSLGAFLRAQRMAKGISLEQVSAATKINLKVLQHLEADDYSSLPAKPFIRGFVSSYVRFIGLDARETLLQFDRFLDSASEMRPNKDGGHSGYVFERREGADSSRIILSAVMGGTLMIGGVALIFLKPHLRGHRATQVERLKQLHEARIAAGPSPFVSGMPGAAMPSGIVVPVVFGPQPEPTASGVVARPSTAQKPPEKAAEKAAEKLAEKLAEKAPEKGANQVAESGATAPVQPMKVITPEGYVVPAAPLVMAAKPEEPPAASSKPSTPSVVIGPQPAPSSAVAQEKTPEKPAEPAVEKEKVPEKVPEKMAEKAPEKAPEKAVESTPSPEAVAAVPTPTVSEKPDPLASGVNLKATEIQYKVVVKALNGDVWVRYKLDDRPVMKFILRQNRVLVLRAAQALRFQTSHWENLTFKLNGAGMRPFSIGKDLVERPSGKTYFLPAQGRESQEDYVTGGAQLPQWIPDSPRTAPATSDDPT